jgi:flagellar motor switch protein FliN/FliY
VPERLEAFARDFFGGVGPVVTTMTNRPIEVTVLGVEEMNPPELLRRMPLPWVLADATYARGLTGGHWLILGWTGAILFGHALAGEENEEALEFLPAYEEVLRELLNQVLSAASASLMPLITRSIGFEPVTLSMIEDMSALPGELSTLPDRLWLIRAQATGDDGFHADIGLTVGADLAREISTVGIEPAAAAVSEASAPGNGPAGIDLILDVALPVSVELGRARMQIQDILKLAPGSIIELDKSAGDPVEILINDRPIAKGEVVVIDENFGVRLTSIVTATERIKTLR